VQNITLFLDRRPRFPIWAAKFRAYLTYFRRSDAGQTDRRQTWRPEQKAHTKCASLINRRLETRSLEQAYSSSRQRDPRDGAPHSQSTVALYTDLHAECRKSSSAVYTVRAAHVCCRRQVLSTLYCPLFISHSPTVGVRVRRRNFSSREFGTKFQEVPPISEIP